MSPEYNLRLEALVDPAQFMTRAEAFCRAMGAEHYLVGAGLKAELVISPIYEEYVALFEGERFEEARTWDLEPTEERYVLEFIASNYLGRATKELHERVSAAEAAATIEWDEHPVAYREAPGLIANEADAVRRHELERRYLEVMATMNPPLEEAEKRA